MTPFIISSDGKKWHVVQVQLDDISTTTCTDDFAGTVKYDFTFSMTYMGTHFRVDLGLSGVNTLYKSSLRQGTNAIK